MDSYFVGTSVAVLYPTPSVRIETLVGTYLRESSLVPPAQSYLIISTLHPWYKKLVNGSLVVMILVLSVSSKTPSISKTVEWL